MIGARGLRLPGSTVPTVVAIAPDLLARTWPVLEGLDRTGQGAIVVALFGMVLWISEAVILYPVQP